MDHALEMGRFAWDDGIEKIVATPHLFREDLSQTDITAIQQKREELGRAFHENDIPVELLAGAEVHISHDLIDEIRKNRQHLVINEGSYMFVEFPQDHVFFGAKDLFFDLMSEGITPIIAHPERNSVFMQNLALLYELVQMGAFVQSNSGSFLGRYGRQAEECVFSFLRNRLIHFVASDGHGVRSIPPKLSDAVRAIRPVIEEEYAHALVHENPEAVLNDQRLPFVPDPVDPKAKKKSFVLKRPKFFKHFFCFVCLLLLLNFPCLSQQAPLPRLDLKGFVFQSDGTSPVEQATMFAKRLPDGEVLMSVPSDRMGMFEIKDIEMGIYVLGVRTLRGNFNAQKVLGIREEPDGIAHIYVALSPVSESERRGTLPAVLPDPIGQAIVIAGNAAVVMGISEIDDEPREAGPFRIRRGRK